MVIISYMIHVFLSIHSLLFSIWECIYFLVSFDCLLLPTTSFNGYYLFIASELVYNLLRMINLLLILVYYIMYLFMPISSLLIMTCYIILCIYYFIIADYYLLYTSFIINSWCLIIIHYILRLLLSLDCSFSRI